MIDDLTDSEIEKIVDLTYSIIEVVTADNEVAVRLSGTTVTLMMTVMMIVRRLLRN